MNNNEAQTQGQAQHFPVMAIGDSLVYQLLSGLQPAHAQVMLEDLNTDGFKLLCGAMGELCAAAILGAAKEESGGDPRMLQHTRVQMITVSSVFYALAENVKQFEDGTHPLSQAKSEDAPESGGAL